MAYSTGIWALAYTPPDTAPSSPIPAPPLTLGVK